MADRHEGIIQKLQALQQNYLSHLPQEIDTAESLWKTIQQDQDDVDALTVLYRLMHRLNGSGMTFGFPEVSDLAGVLERDLQNLKDQDLPVTPDQKKRINVTLQTLKTRVTELSYMPAQEPIPPLVAMPLSDSDTDRMRIGMVTKDAEVEQNVSRQLGYFGYTVRMVPELADLEPVVQEAPPTAFILDVDLSTISPVTLDRITRRRDRRKAPLIFLSSSGALPARLQAVRLGGSAYFTKPVDVSQLIDTLDHLTARRPPEPYRILLIEDDKELATYYANTLLQAGMSTWVTGDPLTVVHPLEEFRPDLVLVDLYMPQCTGLELAAVIRQQPDYVSIPLVFLSTETNLQHHLNALHMGGDDFLTKPISANHLIASVTARVQRARILRSLMVRDSLTGLLNHTAIVEHLYREVARAERHQAPLSFAMIDIDHFKSVNDTYGHPTGDRVLKNLARLLQQRLRQTDIVGRYGGEEFAMILIGTDGEQAVTVIDEIRTRFSQVDQQSDDAEFHVTLSSGIASLSTFDDATRLSNAADKALYIAKRSGRNRVVLADAEVESKADSQ